MKEKIRPIYSELKGYLTVVPTEGRVYDETATSICKQLNIVVGELNSLTSKDYNKFKIQDRTISWNGTYRKVVDSLDYKLKLSGLISRIQGEFFSEEQSITTQPNTVINTSQHQSQTQSQTFVLELQEKILTEITKYGEGTKERTFLQRLKSALPMIKNVTDILATTLKIGAEVGLDPVTMHKILT